MRSRASRWPRAMAEIPPLQNDDDQASSPEPQRLVPDGRFVRAKQDPSDAAREQDLEFEKLAFEREKWKDDLRLRVEEIALRSADLGRSRWSSPLVVAVLGATFAAVGNMVVNWQNSKEQRDLETTRAELTLKLESSKAEAARILEVVKTADPDRAAVNLRVLMETYLISDPDTRAGIKAYLDSRQPGQGLTLPTTTQNTTATIARKDIGWPDVVGRLAGERSKAETCASLVKGYGD